MLVCEVIYKSTMPYGCAVEIISPFLLELQCKKENSLINTKIQQSLNAAD